MSNTLGFSGLLVPMVDDGDQVALFNFPPDWPTTTEELVAESNADYGAKREPMPRRMSTLNPAAKPFTFSGSVTPAVNLQFADVQMQSSSAPATIPSSVRSKRSVEGLDDVEQEGQLIQGGLSMPTTPSGLPLSPLSPSGSTAARRRPPIPDFRHPVSTKTVPASVFKALAPSDAEAGARARLNTSANRRRDSLDDLDIPSISMRHNIEVQKSPQEEEEEEEEAPSPYSSIVDDVFTQSPQAGLFGLSYELNPAPIQHSRRLSIDDDDRSASSNYVPQRQSTGNPLEAELLELIEDRFDGLRGELGDLRKLHSMRTQESSDDIRNALKDFIPVLRSHLSEERMLLANAGFKDESGGVDLGRVQELIENHHEDLRRSLQRDFAELTQTIEAAQADTQAVPGSVVPVIHDLRGHVVNAMNTTINTLAAHLNAHDEATHRRRAEEQGQLLQDILHNLGPVITTRQGETFDLEKTTERLSQAVKPHISQLIDLTSDKKETAKLILDHLLPILTRLTPSVDQFAGLTDKLSAEVRMAVSQVDAHTLKDDVADLVVERLDARLANRDTTSSNLEELATRISISLGPSLEHSAKLTAAQDTVSGHIGTLLEKYSLLHADHTQLASKLALLPDILSTASMAVTQAQTELASKSRALTDIQNLQEVVNAKVDLQVQLAEAQASVLKLNAEKSDFATRLERSEAQVAVQKAENDRLLAQLNSSDVVATETTSTIVLLQDQLNSTSKKLELTGVDLVGKQQQLAAITDDRDSLHRSIEELQKKVRVLPFGLNILSDCSLT